MGTQTRSMGDRMNRQTACNLFIENAGWAAAQVSALAGDASNRRYLRLKADDGTTAVVMDAPPDRGEDVRPFVDIAGFLTETGLSAPRIIAQDVQHGFLLIEDLGDALFAKEMKRDPNLITPLYEAATDVLTHLHSVEPPALPAYNSTVTVPLAALAFEWYQFGAVGQVDTAAKTEFSAAFDAVIQQYDRDLSVLIQRDYHAENLIWLPERTGVARVGLLDFQDAMIGHPAYDLVSVLQDARRDVDNETENSMRARFVEQNSLNRDEFQQAYAVFGAQRNLRILGVFARLCLRDQKPHYVDLIPRAWNHVQTNLRHPALHEVARILNTALPGPTDDVLRTLKKKSGTCSGQ